MKSQKLSYDQETSAFYDQFWHRNVPRIERTREYMISTLSRSGYTNALDAGCGHGLCSIVLSELCDHVLGVDISPVCVATAKEQAVLHNRHNIEFSVQDLQSLDLGAQQFQLVWCWGVAMMAPKPLTVIDNLIECTEVGGELYLGLYLKTWLSPIHEIVRHFCRKFMNTPRRKQFVLNFFTGLTTVAVFLKNKEINHRDDNISIQTQVEDWFYPPYKTFYTIDFILEYLKKRGMHAECIQERLGRMKSATIFVVRGVKQQS